jgi:signal transduction histidine kinase
MSNKYDLPTLFNNEHNILQKHKNTLSSHNSTQDPLIPAYRDLILNYEKLLKLASKIFKISDIQSRVLKDHEIEINRANEHLSQSEEARRQLVSDISHELGTPMTTFQGYVKAMLDGVILPEEQYLRLIYDKVLLVNQLVEDLFELSKLEATKLNLIYKQYPQKNCCLLWHRNFPWRCKETAFVLL